MRIDVSVLVVIESYRNIQNDLFGVGATSRPHDDFQCRFDEAPLACHSDRAFASFETEPSVKLSGRWYS